MAESRSSVTLEISPPSVGSFFPVSVPFPSPQCWQNGHPASQGFSLQSVNKRVCFIFNDYETMKGLILTGPTWDIAYFSTTLARGKDLSVWLGLGHTCISGKGVLVESAPPKAQSLGLMRNGSPREMQAQLPGEGKIGRGQVKSTCIHWIPENTYPLRLSLPSGAILSVSWSHLELVKYTLWCVTLLFVSLWCFEVKVQMF